MALSIDELEAQSVDYLPAREVMTRCGGRSRSSRTTVNYQDNSVNQSQSGISLLSPQVGISALNFNG
jgi:hypothetical protein